MKRKKIYAIILCAAVFVTLLAACSDDAEEALPDEAPPQTLEPLPAEPAEDSEIDIQSYIIDYDEAFAAFSPDTIMMTIGDYTVTWAELYAFIRNNISAILQYGDIHDWSDIFYDDMSYADIVLKNAGETALTYKTVEYGAHKAGAVLSAEAVERMEEEYGMVAEQLGGEEELLKLLWDIDGISSRELFDYLRSVGYLIDATIAKMYGENGELLSDEDAAAYTILEGYLMAKHILRMKTEGDEDTALSEAEEILAKLDDYDGDDLHAYFNDLMWEFTEDINSYGYITFPDGYLFQYGDMVPEFYDACSALEIGAYSDIVETTYGFHIIYRLPIDFDTIPTGYFMQYEYGMIGEEDLMPLRNIIALELFDSEFGGWRDSLKVEYTSAYESLDLAKVFDVGAH